MTLADIHNDYPATAAMTRSSSQQTQTAAMQNLSRRDSSQALTGVAGKAVEVFKLIFAVGFCAASIIIAATMVYTFMIGIPLISS